MKIEFINTSNKYKQKYIKVGKEIYTVPTALLMFKELQQQIKEETDKGLILQTKKVKSNNPFKYPFTKTMLAEIEFNKDELLKKANIEKSRNAYSNKKTANDLMLFLLKELTIDMRIIEDKIWKLKQIKNQITDTSQKAILAYNEGLYKLDKQYRKTVRAIKRVEKQTKKEKIKTLYNSLVRKKTSNKEDCTIFIYLLRELNINAYKVNIFNDKTNDYYSLVLVPIRAKNSQLSKFYFYDISKYRSRFNYPTEKEIKNNKQIFSILGESKFFKRYKNYVIKSIEDNEKTYLKNDKKFKDVFKRLSNDNIEIIKNIEV